MTRGLTSFRVLAFLLAGSVVAEAQEMAQPRPEAVLPAVPGSSEAAVGAVGTQPANPYTAGLEAESLPAEIEEDLARARSGRGSGPRRSPTSTS